MDVLARSRKHPRDFPLRVAVKLFDLAYRASKRFEKIRLPVYPGRCAG